MDVTTDCVMVPTGSGPGTGWVTTGPGIQRNATAGNVGVRGSYYRFASVEDYAPPYVWSGSVRTISLMSPPVFEDGTPAWYRPGLVFHPMYGSSSTPAAGNDENVLIGLGTYDRPQGHVGISAELRAERPAEPYGTRSGYARKHVKGEAPAPFWDGKWHEFKITVHSHAHYTLAWDGVVLADVLEKLPATMSGRNRVGLRADFTDIETRDFKVTTAGRPAPKYPDGYGTNRITLDQMKAKHEAKMHPEFARRFFAYIEAKGGLLGVGGGWRATGSQPDKSGFAPEGESFHQDQSFASGTVGYSAVDLVTGNGSAKHKAPAWADTEDAGRWGLHTFINGEPWHIQCNEMRGWSTWRDAGRPDPHAIALPGGNKPTPTPTDGDDDMPALFVQDTKLGGTFALCAGRWVPWLGKLTPGVELVKIDHPWTRAQILHDQGPEGSALWIQRSKTI